MTKPELEKLIESSIKNILNEDANDLKRILHKTIYNKASYITTSTGRKVMAIEEMDFASLMTDLFKVIDNIKKSE